jgi:hypothetical protein
MKLKLRKRSIWSLLFFAPPLVGAGLGLYSAHARAESRGPTLAIERYFDAVARQDCAALEQSVTGILARELSQSGCKPTFERMRAHKVQYLWSGSPRLDGRDENARIVPIQVRFNDATRDVLVRVGRSSNAWKLATF